MSLPGPSFFDIVSRNNFVWDFLCMQDLVALFESFKYNRETLELVEYTRCRDGQDYLVKFPGFPGVLSTSTDLKNGAGLFPHQLASLQAMHRAENNNSSNCVGGNGDGGSDDSPLSSSEKQNFGRLRGGILGDAPGLGKTITMLALIASTAGVRPVPPPEFWNKEALKEGWKHCRMNVAFKEDVLKTLQPIRQWVKHLTSYLEPPYDDDRFSTIREFELFVCSNLRSRGAPKHHLELFRQAMVKLKAGLDKKSRSMLKSETGRRLAYERELVASCATLVVVPDALLEHWYQQIDKHLNLRIFTEGGGVQDDESLRGIVFLDGVGDIEDVRNANAPLRDISFQSNMLHTWELSKYMIVITTFSRCQAEFKNEVRSGRMQDFSKGSISNNLQRPSKRQRPQNSTMETDSGMSSSPLLSMRWLRLVVDEGHELGTYEAGLGVTRILNAISAERRWVLSGTPTTGDEDNVEFNAHALDQLQRLLFFLRHPKYGKIPTAIPKLSRTTYFAQNKKASPQYKLAHAKSLWDTKVKIPFITQKTEGREELLSVLKDIMVMHRKEDIELPRPIFLQVETDVPVPNDVQDRIQNVASVTNNNGLTARRELENYLHSNEFQSLVDEAQAQYIVNKVNCARQELMQRGGNPRGSTGHNQANSRFGQMNELRPIKAVIYSSKTKELLSVSEQVIRLVGHESVAEMNESAGIGDISSEMSRFRHDMREFRMCPICKRENDLGQRHCSQTLVEVVLEADPERRFLIEPERITTAIDVPSERMGGEPMSSYNKSRKFWRVNDRVHVDIRPNHPVLAPREPEQYWQRVGSNACREVARLNFYLSSDWYFGPLPDSDGDEPNYFLEARLIKWQSCGRFHRLKKYKGPYQRDKGWYEGPELIDSPIERIREDVSFLALDAGLSHGLDLSFVTHLFLLEPIDDAALLEQVTSRAHRLGATGPVQVETIHTFYKLSEKTEEALKRETTNLTPAASRLLQDKEKILSTINCHFCFRQFENIEIAEKHEQANCPRNPDNVGVAIQPFHLSSVYQEIRPPAVMDANT